MARRLLRPYPPLPQSSKRFFRWFRLAAASFVPAAAYLAWTLQRDGQSTAAWSWLLLSLAVVALSWTHPQSPVFLGSLVLVAGALAVASRSVLIGAAGLIFVAVAVWNLYGPVRILVDPDQIARLPAGGAMPGAQPFISAFEAAGWTQEAALSVPIRGLDIVSSLMLAPDRRSFAEVTDVVISLISDFDDERFLLTRNSAVAKLPPAYLTNDLRGAEVEELISSHRQALDLLSQRGLNPVPLEGSTLGDQAIAGERRVVEWHRQNRTRKNSGLGNGPLDGSQRSAGRIDAWLSAG